MKNTGSGRSGGGSALNRLALVILTVFAVGVVAPITATAATAYFSQVRTVKLAIPVPPAGGTPSQWFTAWCPTGYRVTGGGFDVLDPYWVGGGDYAGNLVGNMPISNSSGRQGWRIRFVGISAGEETIGAYVYAQCIR